VTGVHSKEEEEAAVQTFGDRNTPRQRLRFEELPRGFVAFPEPIIEGVARLQERWRYADDYARDSLERHTLAWYYEGLPVAYRSAAGGIEILALGFEEVAAYERQPQAGAKVFQPG
jgi:hypothetical protein